jgi:LPS sulfotransferase NodH
MQNRYSTIDRALHRIAFATWPLQAALADIEDLLYAKAFKDIEIDRPVFVCALPRAGTTLVLELIENTGEFVSHRYRDMPFVLTPMLWHGFSSKFHQSDTARERAHGDGMLINVDSPEAFEEIAWRTFWKEHYEKDRIRPWSNEADPEYTDFFRKHIRKVIAIRRLENTAAGRYVSKNNLNIARLAAIRKIFPRAVVVLLFRHPLQQAGSLLRQHRNFLRIHAEDPFARTYMEAIGHYDFGENLRPVDFDHWLDTANGADPTALDFWVRYWSAAYSNLSARDDHGVHFVSYDALCASPVEILRRLAEILQLERRDAFVAQASRLEPGPSHAADSDQVSPEVLERAEVVFEGLLRRSGQ